MRKYRDSVDFEKIREGVSVLTVVVRWLEAARERGRFVCPVCGKANLTATDRVWTCWSCNAQEGRSDAVGLISLLYRISRVEAAKFLAQEFNIANLTSSLSFPNQRRPIERLITSESFPYEIETWANALLKACMDSHQLLIERNDPISQKAWDYLTGPDRNLKPETIHRHKLGLNLEWLTFHEKLPNQSKPCVLAPGITIPWLTGPFGISGANVRRFHADLRDKYIMASGSKRHWLFPCIEPSNGSKPLLITEGEFDALLARQEIGDLLPVVTQGSAVNSLKDMKDSILLGTYPKLIIAADSDEAGSKCRDMWINFSPRRVIPVNLPEGKDISDLATKTNLRSWITNILETSINRV